MQPTILKNNVFANTSIQHLDLPSVKRIENFAFCGSKLRTLKVENCQFIEEKAFVGEFHNVLNDIEVHCGDLNLNNVHNCTKVNKIYTNEQKTF